MLPKVKNSVVNTVFPIWSITEVPDLCFQILNWATKFKKDTEINTKTVALKENEKKDIKTDMMCYMTIKYLFTYFTQTYLWKLYNNFNI